MRHSQGRGHFRSTRWQGQQEDTKAQQEGHHNRPKASDVARTVLAFWPSRFHRVSPYSVHTSEFVRNLPEEIPCCPKHSTMFVAVFIAVKRTESTRVFVYIQLSQQISIYSGTDAHATLCRCSLKIYFCLHEPYVPLMRGSRRMEMRSGIATAPQKGKPLCRLLLNST